jgi:hypothetical protein
MKRIFTSALILLAIASAQNAFNSALAEDSAQKQPRISITQVPEAIDRHSKDKPLKVKTTILTKKAEEETATSDVSTTNKKDKRDVELTSDVDKILKEMEIDDSDPMTEAPPNALESAYKPVKKNFVWIAFSVILFPILLFTLLIKVMQIAKKRFEEEKKLGPSKEEKLLDELEKEQKKAKKKKVPLSELLGGKPSSKVEYDDEFDRDDEDFEFMVEEVVIVDEEPQKEEKKEVEQPKKEPQPETPSLTEEEQVNPQEQIQTDSDTIDSFEIADNLKFLLTKKDNSTNLVCQLNGQNIVVMRLENAQKFNKVRKIDSKPGRDVYMVKLDSWRGLVEVKENDAKYLMDI